MPSGPHRTASVGGGCAWGLSSARSRIPPRLPVSGAEPVTSEAHDTFAEETHPARQWKGGGRFTRVAVQNPDRFSTSGARRRRQHARDSRASWKLPPSAVPETKGRPGIHHVPSPPTDPPRNESRVRPAVWRPGGYGSEAGVACVLPEGPSLRAWWLGVRILTPHREVLNSGKEPVGLSSEATSLLSAGSRCRPVLSRGQHTPFS